MTNSEILISILVFICIGYLFCKWLHSIEDSRYDDYKCDNCRLQMKLPKYARWELRHSCDARHNETFLQQRKIPDIIEPKEDKIPGEGKTLC